MANDITNGRLFKLDTVGVIKAAGVPVYVRKIVYFPAAVSDDAVIQEYTLTGSLVDTIAIKAGPSDASGVTLDFGPEGRRLNGFKLSVIAGGQLYVYIGGNNLFA